MAMKLSPLMIEALQSLARSKYAPGRVIYFTSIGISTAKALERRGLVKVEVVDPESYGWNRIRITPAGRKAARW